MERRVSVLSAKRHGVSILRKKEKGLDSQIQKVPQSVSDASDNVDKSMLQKHHVDKDKEQETEAYLPLQC